MQPQKSEIECCKINWELLGGDMWDKQNSVWKVLFKKLHRNFCSSYTFFETSCVVSVFYCVEKCCFFFVSKHWMMFRGCSVWQTEMTLLFWWWYRVAQSKWKKICCCAPWEHSLVNLFTTEVPSRMKKSKEWLFQSVSVSSGDISWEHIPSPGKEGCLADEQLFPVTHRETPFFWVSHPELGCLVVTMEISVTCATRLAYLAGMEKVFISPTSHCNPKSAVLGQRILNFRAELLATSNLFFFFFFF